MASDTHTSHTQRNIRLIIPSTEIRRIHNPILPGLIKHIRQPRMRIKEHNPRLPMPFRKRSRMIRQRGIVPPDLRGVRTRVTLCLVPRRAV
jgi:hypothetical protein